MDQAFWLNKWEQQEIQFNQAEVNKFLIRFKDSLADLKGQHVFIPLCGISVDMLWFMQQSRVTGIELSELAQTQFFEDNALDYEVIPNDNFKVYQHPQITYLCGDFFNLSQEDIGPIDLCYDRAAFIALPEPERQRYAEKIIALKPKRILLLTLEYEAPDMTKPPYSITDAEVRTLYGSHYDIQCLTEEPGVVGEHLVARGFHDVVDRVYLMEPKK